VTITRLGATKKYAGNWAQAFGKKSSDSKTASKPSSATKKTGGSTKKKSSGKGAA
jgi:hypothetical protein